MSQLRQEKLDRLLAWNEQRCELRPVYGQDLCRVVASVTASAEGSSTSWSGAGYINCKSAFCGDSCLDWARTKALRRMLHRPEELLDELHDVIDR